MNLILHLLDRPIAFHRILAKVAGSTAGGVFLSQAIYWSNRLDADRDGWFWKKSEEWEEETCLTRKEQETIRKRLKSIGVLEEKRIGMDPTIHYRINQAKLEVLCQFSSTVHGDSHQLCADRTSAMRRSDISYAQIGHQLCADRTSDLYTEITSIDYGIEYTHTQEGADAQTAGVCVKKNRAEREEDFYGPYQEQESSTSLDRCIPVENNLSQKVKTSSEDKLSAAEISAFKNCWNEFKPQAFAVLSNIGPGRAKTIYAIVSEFSDFKAALRGTQAALEFAAQSEYFSKEDYDLEAFAKDNRIPRLAERAIAAGETRQSRENSLAVAQARAEAQARFDVEEDLRMGRYVSPDRLALLGTT